MRVHVSRLRGRVPALEAKKEREREREREREKERGKKREKITKIHMGKN